MTIFLNVVLALACGAALLGLLIQLPPLPQGVIDALTTAMAWASSVGNIVPVSVIFEIVGYVILIEGTLLMVRLVRWLWVRLSSSGN